MANKLIQKISSCIDWGIALYESAMKATLRLPFARIERDDYLRSSLSKHLSEADLERAIEETPTTVVEKSLLAELARRETRKNIRYAVMVSFLSAIPTNWAMWPAIAFDLIFFQIQVFLISQKLTFLYGTKDSVTTNEVKEKANRLMLIVSTIMIGKQKISRAAKSAAGMVGKQIVERYGSRILSKFVIFNTLRQVAKWMGISFTKAMLLETINLLIPIICASISGFVSYLLIAPMAKKLHLHLMEQTSQERSEVSRRDDF